MSYNYNPREAEEALPHDIESFTDFIDSESKKVMELMDQNAEQVNMKPVSQAVEAGKEAIRDAVKLFQSMLGEPGDGPKAGTLYGLLALAKEQSELQN